MTEADDAGSRRSFAVFLMVACAALSVLVVMLALQNLRLKKTISELSVAPSGNEIHAGDSFSGLSLVDWDEQSRSLEFGQGENRTLLLMFSTQCGACDVTLPVWEEVVAGLDEGSGVRVVGVRTDPAVDASDDPAGLMMESLPFPVFPIDYGASPVMSRIPSVPATIVVNDAGIVEQVWYGAPDDDIIEEMRSALR